VLYHPDPLQGGRIIPAMTRGKVGVKLMENGMDGKIGIRIRIDPVRGLFLFSGMDDPVSLMLIATCILHIFGA
jgi:hypothetical protein